MKELTNMHLFSGQLAQMLIGRISYLKGQSSEILIPFFYIYG
jgi:hypothetical protein